MKNQLKIKLLNMNFITLANSTFGPTNGEYYSFPDGGFFQDFLDHYNYYKNQFLFTYYWKKKWKICSGITYNIVNKL